jgi:hypothetical protein
MPLELSPDPQSRITALKKGEDRTAKSDRTAEALKLLAPTSINGENAEGFSGNKYVYR